ncbi:MAG: metal-activated pyridoxal enzyme [Gammaproteobacteria bacterium RIFCSPHIGHO2_12_FULL_35_23]|nr:MAG: metal-activated pyridoxal enzyme [Gammaproteobacteria bacterium RIFCSPHIGHO2_12_FULL_35_23]
MDKFSLDTPCLILDKSLLLKNLSMMQKEAASKNKQVRPHIKTHKCTQLAKLQINQGATGVSAAKLGEVEQLVATGISGLLITSPIVSKIKIDRLIKCLKIDSTIMLIVDSHDNALQLNQAAKEANLAINVLVDIDPGVGRTGVPYDKALDLGAFINHQTHLKLKGIQCYAGNLQHIKDYETRNKSSTEVMSKAASVVKTLKQHNLPCEILTGSGTGTYEIDCNIPEITEIQPGSYAVMDMEYYAIGTKKDVNHFNTFLPAMTMLVSVISANHSTHVTVDAGTKSLYFDPITKPKIISHPGLEYHWGGFGDEHGKIIAQTTTKLPKIGETIELIVPHCDPTINLFDKFYIVENNQVIDEWPIDMRGKSQ